MSGSEKTVMVVDDELSILRFLRAALSEAGFKVVEAQRGRAALDLAVGRKPDIVLLDLGLPDMDGLEVLSGLRRWSAAPVIVLTARGDERDKIAGLDAGADDYLTKPFGVPELLARIRVALRHAERAGKADEPVYERGDLRVDIALRRVLVGKKEVRLSPLQFEILAVLARNAGRVVSQKQLLKEAWAEGSGTPESLRILVHQLRHRIEANPVRPKHLKTEPGVGYRLESPDD
ncbi:MAG: response regulator [Elusimicrobia bacterium]|nr:response regulator [Elusimicrobiota bacterium]